MAAAARLFRPIADSRITVHASQGGDDWLMLACTEDSDVTLASGGRRQWSIRSTLLLRATSGEWRLLHRHADTLALLKPPEL